MKRKSISTLIIGAIICTFIGGVSYANTTENRSVTVGSKTESTNYYRVIAGSFKVKANAERMVEKLKDENIESYLSTETIKGIKYNIVIAGSFKERSNAENMVSKLNDENIEAFITTYTLQPEKEEKSENKKYYLVVVGSYKSIENAKKMVKKLKDSKVESYILSKTINDITYNRVVIGTFEKKVNADNMKKDFEELGYDVFVDIWNEE